MEDLNVKQMMLAAKNIAAEKNSPEEKVLEVIEMAIAAAWRRENGNRDQNVRAELNTETGDAEVFVQNHNRTGPTAETPNVLLVLFWIDLRFRVGKAVIDFAVFVVVDVMIKLLLVAFSQIII